MYQEEYELQRSAYQGEGYDFQTFLRLAGFEDEEVLNVLDELSAYRSIPGTTLIKYAN